MRLGLVITYLLIITNLNTFAQQQATFSQYMFNGLAINPAYAGHHGVLSATVLGRIQSLGVDGAPETQTFALHTPLLREKFSVGILLIRDKIGVIEQMSFNASYAYRIKLSKKARLSFGIQAGFGSYNAEYTKLNMPPNTVDPAFSGDVKSSRPNFGFGIFFHNEKLYAGVSLPHLVNNVFDRGADFATIQQDKPIILNAGYVVTLSRAFKLKPNMLLKVVNGRTVEFDFNLNLLIDEVLWLGASIKTINAVNIIFDVQLTNQIRMGYSYSITTNSFRQADLGSHELMLNYRFNYPKEAIVNPRHF